MLPIYWVYCKSCNITRKWWEPKQIDLALEIKDCLDCGTKLEMGFAEWGKNEA